MFLAPIFLLFLLAVALVLFLALGPLQETLPGWEFWLLLLCVVPLSFMLLAGGLGGWAFRRYGGPMAELMAAADAVADGDFSVRVSEHGPRDIRRLAVSFNRMTAELRQAETQRRNLTADVAHELRTPLTIIQGNLEGVLDGVYPPTEEHVQATLDETRLLARLVEDLQTLSLAESGQLPLHPVRISVADLLADTAASFAGEAATASVDLQTHIPDEAASLEVEVDPDRIEQVLANLVANALRYTPAGGRINLGAEALPGGVRLTVEDTGAGISSEDLPYVFDRFWRGDKSRTRQGYSGSGLGLAIARQLVEANGGVIRVESEVGRGTRFTIEFEG
jgi:two-component system OmpR family sensor kinase/two-component system sensor histidine kinase BaeS